MVFITSCIYLHTWGKWSALNSIPMELPLDFLFSCGKTLYFVFPTMDHKQMFLNNKHSSFNSSVCVFFFYTDLWEICRLVTVLKQGRANISTAFVTACLCLAITNFHTFKQANLFSKSFKLGQMTLFINVYLNIE